MTTFASLTLAYREERWIGPCLEGLKGLDHRLVVHARQTWGGRHDPEDATVEIARGAGAQVVSGTWGDETAQRNAGLAALSDFDWAIIVDADEHYTTEALEALKAECERAERPALGTGGMRTYFGDFDHYAASSAGDTARATGPHVGPHVAVAPRRAGFSGLRIVRPEDVAYVAVPVEHFSYVRSDADMRRKLATFAHAEDLVYGWYANVWRHRHVGMTNLHPTAPEMWPFLAYEPAPAEIKARFPEPPHERDLPEQCAVCGPVCRRPG